MEDSLGKRGLRRMDRRLRERHCACRHLEASDRPSRPCNASMRMRKERDRETGRHRNLLKNIIFTDTGIYGTAVVLVLSTLPDYAGIVHGS